VGISRADHDRVMDDLRGFKLTAETQSWHEDLWKDLSSDARVDTKTLLVQDPARLEKIDPEEEAEDEGFNQVSALASAFLALQEDLPLMVDDRVCQNFVLNSRRSDASAAFGTDCFVMRLLDEDCISRVHVAEAYMKLIKWRYRFLLIPSEVLQTLARDFAFHDLRRVAKYVHDCMRDPGLFGGPEPTEPPIPIAFRYFQDWLTVIAEFVTGVWLDDDFTQDRALELTNWAMTELVPTLPSVLRQIMGPIAEISAVTVLSHAMHRLCVIDDYERANRALRAIAHALGLDDEDFVRLAADVINSHD